MADPDKMDEAFARFEQAFERFEAALARRKEVIPVSADEATEVLRAEVLRLADENERSRTSAREATAKIDSAMGLIRSAIGEGQGG